MTLLTIKPSTSQINSFLYNVSMGEDTGEFVKPYIDIPAEAVADAMMVAQAEMVSPVIINPEKYLAKGADNTGQMEKLVADASSGMCEAASVYSLYFLAQRYPQEFDYMAILKTWDNYRRPKGKLKNGLGKWHTYFIVKDKKGIWYAASPANHTPNRKSSSLTRIYKSIEPQQIVNKIEKVDGGEWPTGDFIRQSLESGKYTSPSLGKSTLNGQPVLNVFNISNCFGHNRAYMDEQHLISTTIQPA